MMTYRNAITGVLRLRQLTWTVTRGISGASFLLSDQNGMKKETRAEGEEESEGETDDGC